jgi:anti-sigma factor RsiW
MKPCFRKRKLIAWLALGELDALQAQDLRAHLETCAGCRRYLEEVSAVGARLGAAETAPGVEPSASFHRNLVDRLRAEPSESAWAVLTERWWAVCSNWRVALPALGAAALVILMLSLRPHQPGVSPSVRTSHPVTVTSSPKRDLSPTVANYQRAALRSLDELDELLTRQGKRNPSPGPIYTASIFALAWATD